MLMRSVATVVAVGLLLCAGLGRAERFTTDLDAVETGILDRQATLPTTGLSRAQKKQQRAFKQALKKLAKDTSSLKQEIHTALAVIPKIDKALRDDEDMQSTLDAATEGLREKVIGTVLDAQDLLDLAPGKVTIKSVQKLIDHADGKVFGSYDAKNRKKELKDIAAAESMARKAAKQVPRIKPPKGGRKCGQGRALRSGERFTGNVGPSTRWSGGKLTADELLAAATVDDDGNILSLGIVGYACPGARQQALNIVVVPPFQGSGQRAALTGYKEDFVAPAQATFGGDVNFTEWDEASQTLAFEFSATINEGAPSFTLVEVSGSVRITKFDTRVAGE